MGSCWWRNCKQHSSSLCFLLFIHLPGDLEENSPVLLLWFIEMAPILQHLVYSTNVWGRSSNILSHDPLRPRTVRKQLVKLKLKKKESFKMFFHLESQNGLTLVEWSNNTTIIIKTLLLLIVHKVDVKCKLTLQKINSYREGLKRFPYQSKISKLTMDQKLPPIWLRTTRVFPVINLDNFYPSCLSFSYIKYDVLAGVFNMKHVKDILI